MAVLKDNKKLKMQYSNYILQENKQQFTTLYTFVKIYEIGFDQHREKAAVMRIITSN